MESRSAFERAGRAVAFAAIWAALAWSANAFAQGKSAQATRQSAPLVDPLKAIERWTSEYRRLGAKLDLGLDASLAPALAQLRTRFQVIDPSENDALIALCDLASIAGAESDSGIAEGRYVADERESAVREQARSVLRSALDSASGEGRGHWLCIRVLAVEKDQPLPRRIAVAEAIIGRHWDSTMVALLSASTSSERGLREACVAALSGWKSEAVDSYMAQLLLRTLREPQFLSTKALLDHFAVRALSIDNPAANEVAQGLARSTVSTDWREAVRRIPLTRALSNELAVPQLIEALSIWHDRGIAGASSRRVEAAIVRELELRAKRHIGTLAERWSTWWKSERARAAEAGAGAANDGAGEGQTEAAFFGLRPWTDRVVFVIDRSGSMAEGFGTQKATSRYTEALREVGSYLQQLGPRTHFNLILFSDEPRSWNTALKPATPAGIDAALRWARMNPPDGGTMLRPAITRALELDPRTGKPDLAKLEADTVIVLCDGATSEGAAWVSPFMRAVEEATCVRFDCVQIGNSGNGTLQALAAESGGQFVLVDS